MSLLSPNRQIFYSPSSFTPEKSPSNLPSSQNANMFYPKAIADRRPRTLTHRIPTIEAMYHFTIPLLTDGAFITCLRNREVVTMFRDDLLPFAQLPKGLRSFRFPCQPSEPDLLRKHSTLPVVLHMLFYVIASKRAGNARVRDNFTTRFKQKT